MSSAAILAQIHALQAKVDALNEAIGHLNNASTSFSQFPPVLEEIGAGWKNSIVINGEPADKGKAVERSKEFQGFIEKISSIIGVISAKIGEYEAKIAALWIEYWAAKKAEEEAAAAAAAAAAYAGTQINGHRAGDSSAVACFKKNTKVLTNKGYVNIQDIKVNDLVMSYNIESNNNEYSKVIKTFEHKDTKDYLYKITSKSIVIEATSKHPICIKNNELEYIEAEKLKINDKLVDLNGNLHSIDKIEFNEIVDNFYNLEVEKNHNYYVTENDILVHNKK